MKALSILQPWASAIMLGCKSIETRGWQTSYRGRLLIHAGKTFTTQQRLIYYELLDAGVLPIIAPGSQSFSEAYPRGVMLGECELINIVPTESLTNSISTREHALGDYSPGRYAWLLANVRKFSEPIAYSGKQGIFEVPERAAVFMQLLRLDGR